MKSMAFDIVKKYLKSQTVAPAETTAQNEPVDDDPILSPGQWYPEFHRLHMQAVHKSHDFNYTWLRRNRPEMYREIKAIEDRIDALGVARLSEITAIMREWREMVLRAYFEQRADESKQSHIQEGAHGKGGQ